MKLNKKGFTLVELLAVIVILAIIMVIAVPAVVNQMQKAKKSSFKIYGEKVLNQAMSTYEADMLDEEEFKNNTQGNHTDVTVGTTNTTKMYCYTLENLGLTATKGYYGYVIVDPGTNSTPSFYLYLTDKTYSASGLTFTGISTNPDTNANTNIASKCPTTCDTITACK